MSRSKKKCTPNCLYFPDMGCRENDWEWSEDGTYKVRKEPKVFKCLYDNHPIDWGPCPREEKKC